MILQKGEKTLEEKIEKRLIQKAQKGDVEAFEQLILDYEKLIYNICLRMLQDEQEAYDGAQEICLKIWKQIKHFEGNAKFSTWLYRIATNQCLDFLRKRKNKEEISLFRSSKEEDSEWVVEEKEPKDPISEHVQQLALQDVMSQALNEVKSEHKQILLLRDLEGYSYEEIAEILGISKGTVKSRLSRARLAMKQILTQDKEPYRSFFRHNIKKEGNL